MVIFEQHREMVVAMTEGRCRVYRDKDRVVKDPEHKENMQDCKNKRHGRSNTIVVYVI